MVRSAYTLRAEDDDFTQPGILVRDVFTDERRTKLVDEVSGSLLGGVRGEVLERAFQYWKNIDAEVGRRIEAKVKAGTRRSRPKAWARAEPTSGAALSNSPHLAAGRGAAHPCEQPNVVALRNTSRSEVAMPEPERYDAVIIGSSEGGKYLAWHLAQAGQRTAVVERRWIGSLPNINCLPSKNEIWSAGVAKIVARAGEFGVTTGSISVDMAKVLQRKRGMVDSLIAFHLERYKASGAELIMGSARLIAPKTVEVAVNNGGTRRLVAGKLFLNLGTHASIPPVPGLAEAQPLTNIEALGARPRLPVIFSFSAAGTSALKLAGLLRPVSAFRAALYTIHRSWSLEGSILEAEGIEGAGLHGEDRSKVGGAVRQAPALGVRGPAQV